MIPIEELKPRRNVNQRRTRNAFWWYLLRNWNFIIHHLSTTNAHLLMIPIEELKLSHHPNSLLQNHLLMIPIEELKQGQRLVLSWYRILLMIPIEELKQNWTHSFCDVVYPFDDTYWGIETWLHRWFGSVCNRFWWYLLRNWNYGVSASTGKVDLLLMIPIEELKLRLASYHCSTLGFWWYLLRNWNKNTPSRLTSVCPFDDTYWGIETALPGVLWALPLLLMIPIEELKPSRNAWCTGRRRPFDDTYWGIETYNTLKGDVKCFVLLMIPIEELKLSRNRCRRLIWRLLMIPIEELKPGSDGTGSGRETAFWWYLLRNWNFRFIRTSHVEYRLLMIPIEELKPNFMNRFHAGLNTFDDTYWGIETTVRLHMRHTNTTLLR